MPETIAIRCSSLPLATACPASQAPGLQIDSSDESAANGSAVHHILALAIGHEHWTNPAEAARLFGADPDEVERLAAWGMRAWRQIERHFPAPQTEVYYELLSGAGVMLAGHLDVLSVIEDQHELRVADFKTGYLDADHEAQLKGYAYLGLLHHPTCHRAYVATIRVRDQVFDGEVYTREELEAWWTGFLSRIRQTERFSPGPHCRYCPRRVDCPAMTALIAQCDGVLTAWGADGRPGTPERFRSTYDALKQLEGFVERVREVLRFKVAGAGGLIPFDDGRALVLTPQQQRRIEARRGLPIIEDVLGADAVADCVTVGKGKVEKAARMQRKGLVTELFDQLEAAGAMTTQTVERLEVKRSTPKIGAKT